MLHSSAPQLVCIRVCLPTAAASTTPCPACSHSCRFTQPQLELHPRPWVDQGGGSDPEAVPDEAGRGPLDPDLGDRAAAGCAAGARAACPWCCTMLVLSPRANRPPASWHTQRALTSQPAVAYSSAGKLIQQLNGQTQRLLGQQSLAAYTGLQVGRCASDQCDEGQPLLHYSRAAGNRALQATCRIFTLLVAASHLINTAGGH